MLKLVDIAESYIKSNIHWRVEFTGAFPEGYESRDFIDKSERPIRRNPKIARMLYYSKDIESFGTGLKRIAEACDAARVRYEFKKMKFGFVVCFYRSQEKNDKKPIKTDRYERIVQYVKEHGSINNMEAREPLGLADSTVKRLLKEMVEETILVVEGERKTRRYLLKDEE